MRILVISLKVSCQGRVGHHQFLFVFVGYYLLIKHVIIHTVKKTKQKKITFSEAKNFCSYIRLTAQISYMEAWIICALIRYAY